MAKFETERKAWIRAWREKHIGPIIPRKPVDRKKKK